LMANFADGGKMASAATPHFLYVVSKWKDFWWCTILCSQACEKQMFDKLHNLKSDHGWWLLQFTIAWTEKLHQKRISHWTCTTNVSNRWFCPHVWFITYLVQILMPDGSLEWCIAPWGDCGFHCEHMLICV
jgi:hypothetical protein